jgi:HEPN domain-containing protein
VNSLERSELLKRRCKAFYEYSQLAFERGDYDTTLFMCEQAAQLCLKSILLRLLGFTLRGHGLRELLGALSKALKELNKGELSQRVSLFAERRREALRLLEDAYVGCRYLARTYEREDAERALDVVRELIEPVEGVERDVFS